MGSRRLGVAEVRRPCSRESCFRFCARRTRPWWGGMATAKASTSRILRSLSRESCLYSTDTTSSRPSSDSSTCMVSLQTAHGYPDCPVRPSRVLPCIACLLAFDWGKRAGWCSCEYAQRERERARSSIGYEVSSCLARATGA